MTPQEIQAIVEAGMCPWCSRGPFKLIAGHTQRAHGIDRTELRDMAGLTYNSSLCDPDLAARKAELMRNMSPSHRTALEDGARRGRVKKRRLSAAAKEINRQKLEAARSPEQMVAALAAARSPEATAKRLAAQDARSTKIRANFEHGTEQMYATGACRCEACREAHAVHYRHYRAKRRAQGNPVRRGGSS